MKMAHDYLAHWLSTRVSVYVVSVCVCASVVWSSINRWREKGLLL